MIYMQGSFVDKIRSRNFVITAEITPPKGSNPFNAIEDAALIRNLVDAINITDNNRGVMRMSPISLGKVLQQQGYEPIIQMTCRDRNRLALQSDLLGAAALGLKNFCIMTGDHVSCGDHLGAKSVYDLDSVQLISMIRKMESGFDLSGNKLEDPPEFILGAVSNINPLKKGQMLKLRKKATFGLDFIQTQAVYDTEMFKNFCKLIGDLETPIIAGIIPLKSARMARFMNANIPGIHIDGEIIDRLDMSKDPIQEGLDISCEIIKDISDICQGIHLMPVGQHLNTQKLLKQAGF